MKLSPRHILPIAILLLSVLTMLMRENTPQENFGLLVLSGIALFLLRKEMISGWKDFRETHQQIYGSTPSKEGTLTCQIAHGEGENCDNPAHFVLKVEVFRPGAPDAMPPNGVLLCCKDHHPNRNAGNEFGKKFYQTDDCLRNKNIRWTEAIALKREQKTPLGLGG